MTVAFEGLNLFSRPGIFVMIKLILTAVRFTVADMAINLQVQASCA